MYFLTSANTLPVTELSSSSRIICSSEHKEGWGTPRNKSINSPMQVKSISLLWSKATNDNNDHRLTEREILQQHECFVGTSTPSYWIYPDIALQLHQHFKKRKKQWQRDMWVNRLSTDNNIPNYTHCFLAWEKKSPLFDIRLNWSQRHPHQADCLNTDQGQETNWITTKIILCVFWLPCNNNWSRLKIQIPGSTH